MHGRFVLGGLLLASAAAQVGGPRWIERAWDAYKAAQSGLAGRAALLAELRRATELRDSPAGSETHAYVQALFDGLIRGGSVVPLDVLAPFEDTWPAETVILMARLDAQSPGYEDALLAWRARLNTLPEWVAVSNLLYRAGSRRFFSKLVSELQPTHGFVVQSDSDLVGLCGGGFGCVPPQWKLPAGLPPIGVYYLLTEQTFGADETTIAGPVDVVYRRATVPATGQASGVACDAMGDAPKQSYGIRYLAALTGMPVRDAYGIFRDRTTIVWTGREAAAIEVRDRLDAQARSIVAFVNKHRAALGDVAGIQLQIAPIFTDARDDRSEALPSVMPLEITLP